MRRPKETLDDLLLADGRPLGVVAEAAGIDPKSLLRLRRGAVAEPQNATMAALARALGVDPARVRAAIAASRAAGRQAE